MKIFNCTACGAHKDCILKSNGDDFNPTTCPFNKETQANWQRFIWHRPDEMVPGIEVDIIAVMHDGSWDFGYLSETHEYISWRMDTSPQWKDVCAWCYMSDVVALRNLK